MSVFRADGAEIPPVHARDRLPFAHVTQIDARAHDILDYRPARRSCTAIFWDLTSTQFLPSRVTAFPSRSRCCRANSLPVAAAVAAAPSRSP